MTSTSAPEVAPLPDKQIAQALALLRAGYPSKAREIFESIAATHRSAVPFKWLASIETEKGAHRDAVRWLQRAAEIEPGDREVHYNLGRACKAAGDVAGAERAYREALRIAPSYLDAWVSLGILLRGADRLSEAEACHREALQLDPDSFLATLNLGNVLLAQYRPDEAVICFEKAVQLKSFSAEAHNNLGRALLLATDTVPMNHFWEAIKLRPDYVEATEGMADCLMKTGDFAAAAELFGKARGRRPDYKLLTVKLADAWFASGDTNRSYDAFEQLSKEKAASSIVAAAKAGMAMVLNSRGQYTAARELFQAALRVDPHDIRIRMAYAMHCLKIGQFREGWFHYEIRAKRRSVEAYRERAILGANEPLDKIKWRGESLAGRTLLITSEQGLGDEINFASMFPEIVAQAGHCIIECDQRLQPLLSRTFPTSTILGIDRLGSGWRHVKGADVSAIPRFDCWSQLGSLGGFLRTGPESFPARRGYLQADPERVAYWRARLDALGPGPKIGISWKGGLARTRAEVRSLSLDRLLPVLTAVPAHFVSLQYGDRRAELEQFRERSGCQIHLWQEAIDDYDETAALQSALDLTISVCTAIVHLGGALGCPVWVLVPFVSEWRYGTEGDSLPWYPSIRLHRQAVEGEWDGVLEQVVRELQRFVPESGAASASVAAAG